MTDRIVLARSASAAFKFNVSGTGNLEDADRTPDWDYWRGIAIVEPWEAAALWKGIEPRKVRTQPNGWITVFEEGPEFKDRLDLVEAHLYGALKPPVRPYGKVDLRQLAAWVRGFPKWPAPAELLALADKLRRDPFGQQYWNLMQVLAWVYLRDRNVVRDAGTPANERGHFFEEHTMPDGRRELVERPVGQFTTTSLDVHRADRGSACYPAWPLAQDAIIEALQAGRLTAYGLKNGKGNVEEIPAASWADLKFWYEPDFAGRKDLFRYGATHWHNLTFQRKDVLAIWPDRPDQLDDRLSAEEQSAAPPANIFKTMKGLKWSEVSITFIESEAVRVSARGKKETFTYDAMGFRNLQSRMAKPNKVWGTLRTLAIVINTSKTLTDVLPPQTDFKQRMSRLRRALQEFFGIKDDPIAYGADGYAPVFVLAIEEHVISCLRGQTVTEPDDEDEEDIAAQMSRPPGG